MSIEATIAVFGFAALLAAAGSAARLHAARVEEREEFRAAFFAAADVLVRDPRTPESIIHEIEALGGLLDSKTLVLGFIWRVLRGRRPGKDGWRQAIEQIPAELRPALVMAWTTAVFALTYNNAVVGTIVRRMAMPA